MKFDANEIDLAVLIENMPDVVFYLDRDLRLMAFNPSSRNFFSLIGCDELRNGMDIFAILPEKKRRHLLDSLHEVSKRRNLHYEEMFRRNGLTYYFDISVYSLSNMMEEALGYGVVIKDITNIVRGQQALMEAEKKYRRLFQQNPCSVYVIALDDMQIMEVNDTAIRQYGYTRDEFLRMTIFDLRPENEYSRIFNFMESLKQGNKPMSSGIWKHMRKNGEVIYMEIAYHLIFYNHKKAILTMANNVTERMRLEEKLAYEKTLRHQQITQAVIDAQEKERSEIGRELHDNVNQILGATKLYIEMAKTQDSRKLELLDIASANLVKAVDEIRKLSKELITPSITSLGLEETVAALVDELTLAHHIYIHVDFSQFFENDIDEKLRLNIFRIIQEQLNNIIKHAEAEQVFITVSRNEKDVVLSINDDGRGFDTASRRKGVGVSNIMSRAELYKGKVELQSAPGEGCHLKIVFPLESPQDFPQSRQQASGREIIT
jgi:two-component system, NarL family, sensor histidine kinase UhpB